ncbi:hypothetical protein [Leeuwenhoekiella sp. ZYFB001]|uniref:hypothetical protein n=1 Tax=Leeuwenhoekiella sp. ZYFB001 TaxID=2719912 RepID=UPI00143213E5|nr:hypothetical protein [Leeuwenhoekiella sp. ZYFB001]
MKLSRKKREAINFLDAEIQRIFESFNYVEYELWYVHPKDENLAFWISDAKEIIETNQVFIIFEVWKELKTKTSEEEIQKLIEIKSISPCLYHDRVTDKKGRYKLVTFYEQEFIGSNINFSKKLRRILREVFFSPDGIEAQALHKLNLGLEPALKTANN